METGAGGTMATMLRQRGESMKLVIRSLFDRTINSIIWVAFALLSLLPMLSLLVIARSWVTGGELEFSSSESLAVALFAGVSLFSGAAFLLHLGSRLRDVNRSYAKLLESAVEKGENGAGVVAGGGESGTDVPTGKELELYSLSESLSTLQRQLSSQLSDMQRQARFLDNLRRLLDNTSDLVLILGKNDEILFSNQASRRVLGLLPDTNLRHALEESALRVQDARHLADILESWHDHNVKLHFKESDDTHLELHCVQTVIHTPGNPRSKIVVLRDVTERSRMERQLYRSEKLAALGQLISGVAHELNNPLTAILGFSQLCRNEDLSPDELQANLTIIEQEATRTSHIVENLLDFSRRRSACRKPTNLHRLLERCLTLLSYNFRTDRIEVHRCYDDELPVLLVDEYKVQQVFMNILINAAQAMRDAKTPVPVITIRTSRLRHDVVSIEIADNGPGIESNIQESIFSPFFTTKGDDLGTGLGLPISRQIVEEHGGTLCVDSRNGNGAAFTVELPVDLSAPIEANPSGIGGISGTGNKGRVLVMDDEPSILSLARQALQPEGVRVEVESTMSGTREKLSVEPFDVLVADVHMPQGDGTDFLEWITENSVNPHCRVILFTGNPRRAAALKSELGETVPIMSKPFTVNDFCSVVMGEVRKSVVSV